MSIFPPVSRLLVFGLGTIVGSFLNVCIWRLPAQEPVVRGRSVCRCCRRVIRWYDNVPLASFLWLRGRCRFCGARISPLYPAVELATGLLFWALWVRFGATAATAIYAALGAALILLSVIDAREMFLPEEVTLPGLALGLALSACFPALHGAANRSEGLLWSIGGAVAGGGFLWGVGAIGSWLAKREAMGGGDVKLMAMVGALIGPWKVLLVNLILAPLAGSLVGLVIKARYRRELIPYGPFLSLGTLAAIFWGDRIVAWYRLAFVGPF